MYTWSELTTPARLADEPALDLVDVLADRLAVRDLRLADVRVDAELASQAVTDDVEVQLPHPEITVWPVSSSYFTTTWGPRRELLQTVAELVWSAFVFGSTATEIPAWGS